MLRIEHGFSGNDAFFVTAITKKMAARYYFATFFMLQAPCPHQFGYDGDHRNKAKLDETSY